MSILTGAPRWALWHPLARTAVGTRRRATAVVAAAAVAVGTTGILVWPGDARPLRDSPYYDAPTQTWGTAAGRAHAAVTTQNADLGETLSTTYPQPQLAPPPTNSGVVVPAAAAAAGLVTGFQRGASVEVVEERSRFERVYRNLDGTLTTEFSSTPLNYRLADGSWASVDSALVPEAPSGTGAGGPPPSGSVAGLPQGLPAVGWHNRADSVDIRFAAAAVSSLATLRLGEGAEISFGLQGSAPVAGRATGNTVVYPGVQPDVDLTLQSDPGAIKETLTLRSPAAARQFTFPLQLTGLTARVEDGQVQLLDGTGTQQAVIPAGFMEDATPGDAADRPRSDGVAYSLVAQDGGTALRVTLDDAWLDDPARKYPVEVDPSVWTNSALASVTVARDGAKTGAFDVGQSGTGPRAGYLSFPDTDDRLHLQRIFDVDLELVNTDSASCRPSPVSVYPVLEQWRSSGSGLSYPGPRYGPALATASFAYGHVAPGENTSACPRTAARFALGEAGRALVQGWADGDQQNHGFTIRAPGERAGSAKTFAGAGTTDAPKLYVTHSTYGADYRIVSPEPSPPVLQNSDGTVRVEVTNRSADSWSAKDFYLGYRAIDDKGQVVAFERAAGLGQDLARGASATLDAIVKPLPAGTYFLDFTMVREGGQVFTDERVPPARLRITVPEITPTLRSVEPPSGYQTPVLRPVLRAEAVIADAPDRGALRYSFELCGGAPGTTATDCTTSEPGPERSWTVPEGRISWGGVYQWRAIVADDATSVASPRLAILTTVPQPAVTSQLADGSRVRSASTADPAVFSDPAAATVPPVAPGPPGAVAPAGPDASVDRDASGVAAEPATAVVAVPARPGIDPGTGNFVTTALDAHVATIGPELAVRRTYNSLDDRRTTAFGSGWSTVYDMRVVPDGSGGAVVTYADGRRLRFGRNADGSYTAPPGHFAVLEYVLSSRSWLLWEKGGTSYLFTSNGHLVRVTDGAGRRLELNYDPMGTLLSAVSRVDPSQPAADDRALTFAWSGGHVSAVTAKLGDRTLAWTYRYDTDSLAAACGPEGLCTKYEYGTGSHYVSSVLDDSPAGFWRMAETGDAPDAADETAVAAGEQHGTYREVELGAAGPIDGPASLAASFNGTSSQVELPSGTLRHSRDTAVELWFRATPGHSGPLLGYQDRALGEDATVGVPLLYVGDDGRLRGQFATGSIDPMLTDPVQDGRWHHVALSVDAGHQTLYLDGRVVGTLAAPAAHESLVVNQVGAAYATSPTSWPSWGADPRRFFTGDIAEVAVYDHPLGGAAVAAHVREASSQTQLLTTVSLPSGKSSATVTYDDLDRVTQYVDADGGTWRVDPARAGGNPVDPRRRVEVAGPGGTRFFTEYDALTGRLVRAGMPTIASAGVATATGQPPYAIRTFHYDSRGYFTGATDEIGNRTVYVNDSRGNPTSRTTCRTPADPVDARGRRGTDCATESLTYPRGLPGAKDLRHDLVQKRRDARSRDAADDTYATVYSFTAFGGLRVRRNPDGGRTETTFSVGDEQAVGGGRLPAGLALSTSAPAAGGRQAVTRYGYTRFGDLATTVGPTGLLTRHEYDTLGRRVGQVVVDDTFRDGLTSTFSYDDRSHQTASTEPAATNLVTGVRHQRQTLTGFDIDGNVVRIEERDLLGVDAPRVRTFELDGHNRLAAAVDATGARSSYGYDDAGNATTYIDAKGNQYEYAYTPAGAVAEVRLRDWQGDRPSDMGPDGSLVLHSYRYDGSGQLVAAVDAMGREHGYSYYGDGLLRSDTLVGFHNADGSRRDLVLALHEYDAAGHPTRLVSGNGARVTAYDYDASGRRVRESQDEAGLARATGFTYDTAGNLVRRTRSGKASNVPWDTTARQVSEFGYDLAGSKTSETTFADTAIRTDRVLATTTYRYDRRGLLVAEVDPRGTRDGNDATAYTRHRAYDELGRLTSDEGPAVPAESGGEPSTTVRPATRTGYDTFGDATESLDPVGRLTRTRYDAAGRPTMRLAPAYTAPGTTAVTTPTTRTLYDPLGRVQLTGDPDGTSTHYEYDQLGRVVVRDEAAPTGFTGPNRWRFTYTDVGELLSTTAPDGARTEATYDDLGRKLTDTEVERFPALNNFTVRVDYDDLGNVVRRTSPSGLVTAFAVDPLGQRTGTLDPAGVTTSYGYDGLGRQVRQSDGLGRTTRRGFDAADRLTSESDLGTNGSVMRSRGRTYDAVGNLVARSDATGAVTRFGYDAANRLVREESPTRVASTYGYDATGFRTRATDGRGNATVFTVNALGLPESVIEPPTAAQPDINQRLWTTAYDVAGHAIRVDAPGGVSRGRTFDSSGRLVSESGTEAEAATTTREFGYDQLGRIASVQAPGAPDTFTYNDRGDLLTAVGPSGTSSFVYDADGRTTIRTDAAGTTTYAFVAGRLASAQDGVSATVQKYGYDLAGQLTSVDYGAGRTRRFGYDDLGRTARDILSNGTGATVSATRYAYDAEDRVTGVARSGGARSSSDTVAYDAAGRPVSWTAGGTRTTYRWDDAGNRVAVDDTIATYDERNRLVGDGDITYTWTPRGTLASRTLADGSEVSTSDAFDRLVTSGAQTYAYDGLDRVVSRGEARFAYAGVSSAPVGDGSAVYARGADDRVLAVGAGAVKQLQLSSVTGEVVLGFDAADLTLAGAAASRRYDPFGVRVPPVSSDGTIAGNLGFCGGWTDPADGRVRTEGRWYDPSADLYLSAPIDPTALGGVRPTR